MATTKSILGVGLAAALMAGGALVTAVLAQADPPTTKQDSQ